MDSLNLPAIALKLKRVGDKPYIFDSIRRKYVVLTPEEWVRQHFISLLIDQYGYPRSLFAVETGHYYHKLAKRSDIMVLSQEGVPFLLVECKAPKVKLGEVVFAQIARYNFTLRPAFLAVTNGLAHYCFRVSEDGVMEYLDDFPAFPVVQT